MARTARSKTKATANSNSTTAPPPPPVQAISDYARVSKSQSRRGPPGADVKDLKAAAGAVVEATATRTTAKEPAALGIAAAITRKRKASARDEEDAGLKGKEGGEDKEKDEKEVVKQNEETDGDHEGGGEKAEEEEKDEEEEKKKKKKEEEEEPRSTRRTVTASFKPSSNDEGQTPAKRARRTEPAGPLRTRAPKTPRAKTQAKAKAKAPAPTPAQSAKATPRSKAALSGCSAEPSPIRDKGGKGSHQSRLEDFRYTSRKADNGADLIRLHKAFLQIVLLHIAHHGRNAPIEIAAIAPNISRNWGKRDVTVDDIRRCVALETLTHARERADASSPSEIPLTPSSTSSSPSESEFALAPSSSSPSSLSSSSSSPSPPSSSSSAPSSGLSSPSSSPFVVCDYGRGRVCVELGRDWVRENEKASIDEARLCRQFEDNVRRICAERFRDMKKKEMEMEKEKKEEKKKDKDKGKNEEEYETTDANPQLEDMSLSDLPLAELIVVNADGGIGATCPLLAKGHRALSELKNQLLEKRQAKKETEEGKSKQKERDKEDIPAQNQGPADPAAAPDASVPSSTMSLLDRIRLKQLIRANAPPPPSAAELRRRAALSRVPDVAATVSMLSLANAAPRQAFTMALVSDKLRDSLRTPISGEEGANCVRLIAREVAPEWIKVVMVGVRETVVIQRDGRPVDQVLQDRVQKLLG